MSNVIKFEALEIDVLIGMANESAGLVESSARKAVEHAERCGRALIAIKAKLPHGEWGAWLGRSFDYSQEHARRYMQIASNSTRVLNLKDATSIREALRMIADDPETPKRERKPSVDVIEVAAEEPRDIAAEVAAECGVSRDQIIRDGEYAEAVDAVSQIVPDIRAQVRSGAVRKQDVLAAAKVATSSPEKAAEIVSGKAKAKAKPTESKPVKTKAKSDPKATSSKADEIIRLYADKATRTDQVIAGIRKGFAVIESHPTYMQELVQFTLARLTEEELMDVFLICKGTREKFTVPIKKPTSGN